MSRKAFWEGPLTKKQAIALHAQVAIKAVNAVAQYHAAHMAAYAKKNARWQDRTGNARQGLHSYLENEGTKSVRIYISHAVSYGENLETVSAGAFAIIQETIDTELAELMRDLEYVFRRK